MPDFPPVRAGRGRRPTRGALGRRRIFSAALAVSAAGLAAAAGGSAPADGTDAAEGTGERERPGGAGRPGAESSVTERGAGAAPVSAPVRIADPATVRLLSPGDRVDVLASGPKGDAARIVATGARVAQVPKSGDTVPGDGAEGSLIVVVVPRRTAAVLAGAAAESRMAVTLC
ncbi:hypothetical protein [Streptomyces reniochalinae]|uniref:Flp pilus assembly protein RcpC/CpaB domain-containing protein n=1 Tax=Streptomyces reniochalinae TaxID=2250578 RepID=A0A367EZ37_9ACTN|nr:hypothetical protein [Streptomyces reniochalinae]RCG23333.1 hypothetical protein DQ392_05340 [Streptomyces reniochalinae]